MITSHFRDNKTLILSILNEIIDLLKLYNRKALYLCIVKVNIREGYKCGRFSYVNELKSNRYKRTLTSSIGSRIHGRNSAHYFQITLLYCYRKKNIKSFQFLCVKI